MSQYPQTVTVPTTDLGDAEAVKDGRDDYWVINYPWTSDKFYGSVPQVRAFMKKEIAVYDAEVAELEGSP